MTLPILTVAIRAEEDVVIVRRRAHQIARLLEFENVEQTRIATAVSEIARNAYEYGKGGKAEFYIDDACHPTAFCVRIADKGPGIAKIDDILEGHYESQTGMGVGMTGARRLMDIFKIESGANGTAIVLGKNISAPHAAISQKSLANIAKELTVKLPGSPAEDMHHQNQEIMLALKELERRQSELSRLNQELAETNRGVVALYAELDARAEEAQRANAVKTRFLSHMTHEFRTPVNSVLNLTKFLLDRTDGDLTREQEIQLRLIQKSVESLSEMVNDLLDLAKVEAGKVTMRIEEFTAGELFASLRGVFRPLAKNPNVEMIFDLADPAFMLRNDEGKISQILRNFISNAMKFTESGSIRLTMRADEAKNEVTFSVADTGIGIAPADQPRIFEEFNQIENRFQKKVKGTGLGLPLSKKLAEVLGGSVALESKPQEGSIFSLTVPIRLKTEATEEQAKLAFPHRVEVQSGTDALIIDDNEATCYTLRRALTSMAWGVTEARDGQQGLTLAKKNLPNLIFLDLIMPDMTGFEVLERLKRAPETCDIPVVIHTSQMLSTPERAGLNALVAGIISKDMNANEIADYVKALISAAVYSEAS